MPVDQSLRGPLHHVGRALVGTDMVAETRTAEHDVVAQLIRVGELCVVVRADRLAGQIAGDVDQADAGCGGHFIHSGVIGRPCRWRYSAMLFRLFNSSAWPGPNRSQKSPTQPLRPFGATSGYGLLS